MKNFIDLHIKLKRYDDRPIFSDEKILLPNNGLFFLLGENGSGKSTLLNILSTRDTDFEGTYRINDTLLTKKNSDTICDSLISYIPQVPILLDDRTVLDNLLFVFPSADRKKALALLEKVSLKEKADQPANSLSTGEKQRLNLSRGIYEDKPILLVDEITSNLDKENALLILDYLKQYAVNHLVIFATHDDRFKEEFDGSSISIKDRHITIDNTKYNEKEIENRKVDNYSFFHEVKRFFKEEKLLCIFIPILLFFLQFALLGQAYLKGFADYSYVSTIKDKIYEETYPAIFIYGHKLDYTEDELNRYSSANQVLTGAIGLKKGNYRFGSGKGEIISSIVRFREKDKERLNLICGTYPRQNREIIISDVCFDTILRENNVTLDYESALKDDNLTQIDGSVSIKITGIYKSDSADFLEKKLDGMDPDKPETSGQSDERVLLGYKIDTAFGFYDDRHTALVLVENTPDNLRIAKENNELATSDVLYLYTTLISNDDSKDHISNLKNVSRTVDKAILPTTISLCLCLFFLLITFIFKNRLRYPLRLLLGEKEKRLKFYPVITMLLLCLSSFVFSYLLSIGILSLFYISIARHYDFLFGLWYSKMNLAFMIPLLTAIILSLLFLFIIRYVFFREARMKSLIKEK